MFQNVSYWKYPQDVMHNTELYKLIKNIERIFLNEPICLDMFFISK
jgi:hypothetical protein